MRHESGFHAAAAENEAFEAGYVESFCSREALSQANDCVKGSNQQEQEVFPETLVKLKTMC